MIRLCLAATNQHPAALLRQGWHPLDVLEVCWVAYQKELAEISAARKMEKDLQADTQRRSRQRRK